MWEADGDPSDTTKKYDELLNKVKDYSRKRKLDGHVAKVVVAGGDPMDVAGVHVGAVQEQWYQEQHPPCEPLGAGAEQGWGDRVGESKAGTPGT